MKKIMDSGTVAKFSTTITMHTSIWDRGTICGKPLLEEIQGRRFVMWNGDLACATLAMCNEDAASLAIDAHKMLETFDGIDSFCGSSGLIHMFNDGTTGIKSGAINKFSLIVNVCNYGGCGWAQDAILHMFPMWVAKKTMLMCTIGNILWSISKEDIKRLQVDMPVDHNTFQVESRSKMLLVAMLQ